jgi:hypothetical protein
MAFTAIERVRQKISDKTTIARENALGDGVSKFFKLGNAPITENPEIQVWINENSTTAFTLNADDGVVEFTSTPAANDEIVFQYYWSVFSDDEIQDFLDQYNNNVNISAAHLLMALAADAARIAKRETLIGGGGVGQATRDTSVAAKELRASAKALMDWEIEYGADNGNQTPAEGLTEIPWTEAAWKNMFDQDIIRNDL